MSTRKRAPFIITEPRYVLATDLAQYAGWRLSPVFAVVHPRYGDNGGMVSGVLLSAEVDGTDVVITYEHDVTDGRGRTVTVTDTAILSATCPGDVYPLTRAARVEVVTSHAVPDSVPGDTREAQYSRLFYRVDGEGISIAEAIARFDAEASSQAATATAATK